MLKIENNLFSGTKSMPAKTIISASVSGTSFDENLSQADTIEILAKPHPFHTVGQVYESFEKISDKRVKELLLKANKERNHH